ncbi:hypothetical protein [Thermomonospora umbrina]|uniref:Uncharacterized protein n=1 Tax=Thermomonospora umbrina TaxID=111806 RepID=A0A3D9STY1_9ACTN|nr:hypothetical protein [Thermomonospora umbrina]REE96034.1 hypothetical protein DFJ69_1455 [Thermomonospora umbrina]
MIDAETGMAGKGRGPGRTSTCFATFQEQQQRQRSCAARMVGQALVPQSGGCSRSARARTWRTVPADATISTHDSEHDFRS